MSHLRRLREQARASQERQGWRIARIEPAPASPRVRYGIPVLLALALLALGAMAGVLVVPLARQAAGDPGATVFTLMTPAHAFLGLMILLFAVPLALGLYGMVRRLVRGRGQRWAAVTARCLDRDVQPVVNYDAEGGEEHGWSYRLLCEFELGGDTYRATPDGHDAAEGEGFHLFETPGAAHTFLDAQLDEAGRCRLLVSADDPRRAKLAVEGGLSAEGGLSVEGGLSAEGGQGAQ